MQINRCILTLLTDRPVVESPTTLRGFIAKKFYANALLHNHTDEEGFFYSYPRVQYKIINRIPIILGINEGSEAVRKMLDIEQLNLRDKEYEIINTGLSEEVVCFGVTDKILSYKFLTPWLALNERNYERYKDSSQREQIQLLKKILIGNILSMAKGLEYVVTEEIKVKNLKLKMENIKVKNIKMIGFIGDFEVNFNLPDYIGLGKMVSRGFGTIKKTNEK